MREKRYILQKIIVSFNSDGPLATKCNYLRSIKTIKQGKVSKYFLILYDPEGYDAGGFDLG